jgi:hypothetical protein
MDRLLRTLLGTSDLRREGYSRALRGFRRSDRRELWFGLAMTALAFIRNNRSGKELLFRKEVPEGSAIVVHHKRRGDPKIEVIKPG